MIAFTSIPDAVFNEMVLQRKEKYDQQKALDKTKAAKAELKKRVLEGAEQSGSCTKQTSIAVMQTKMRSDLDQQWSRFVFHAGVPFHLTEDAELDAPVTSQVDPHPHDLSLADSRCHGATLPFFR